MFYTQSTVRSPLSIFIIFILLLTKQISADRNIRRWKNISCPTKSFLDRQKYFSSDETDFSTDRNILNLQKILTFVHYGFRYVTVFLFFLGGGGGSRRGSRLGIHVLYRPLLINSSFTSMQDFILKLRQITDFDVLFLVAMMIFR